MRNLFLIAVFIAMVSAALFLPYGCSTQSKESEKLSMEEMISRGKYLTDFGGCNDCHTPKVYTEMGPVPDTTRLLAGYFNTEPLPAIDLKMIKPGNWYLTDKNLSAWVGTWGISYAANLTPDKATGLGTITEELFIKTLREGKFKGVGRPLLPPMPWPSTAILTDEDLKCLYAYLQSIPAIHNEVPLPTPPDKIESTVAMK
jgi:hypothetical protein